MNNEMDRHNRTMALVGTLVRQANEAMDRMVAADMLCRTLVHSPDLLTAECNVSQAVLLVRTEVAMLKG